MQILHSPGRIPLFSELGLLVLLAWMVSGWLLPEEKTELSGLVQESAGYAAVLPDLTGLLTIPLFGEAPAQIKPPKPVVKVAAPVVHSPLTFELLGTVVAGEESAAIILIAAGSDQRIFFIGDVIQPGVTLYGVEEGAIVVQRGDMLERVSLEQGEKLDTSPLTAKDPVNAAASVMKPDSVAGTTATGTVITPGMSRQTVDRTMLQEKISDFPSLMSEAKVVPHFVDGKADGFLISDIVSGSLYQQVGLQNGDIIRKVNGKRVSSAQQAMAIYRALENATSIDLELMRAGQMRQVHYDLQ